jgi:hypothetical protein
MEDGMEPVSLSVGLLAAALLSKAAERAGEHAVDAGAGALTRFAAWVRERVSGHPAATALERVQDAPDSPARVRALGEALDRHVLEAPGFAAELKAQIEQARAAGVQVRSIAQSVVGDQNVQVADVQGTVTVTYGDPPAPPVSR